MTSAPLDDDMLAAEYVLGALDLAERSAVEDRLRRDPGFGDLVADWQNRLSGLNDDYEDAVAPNLLPQIEARLFPTPVAPKTRWFAGWLGWAATAAAAVAIAVFFVFTPPTPSLIASLSAEASPLRYEVAIAGDALTLTRVAGTDAEAGKDYELWIIEGDKAPVSLGVFAGTSIEIALPDAMAGYILAVSLEPTGGSPTGAPTGPILAAGPLTEI